MHQKFDILYLFIKSSGIIAKVNHAKNSSKVFLGFETTISNLGLYRNASDLATLSNLLNIFFKFWIVSNTIR